MDTTTGVMISLFAAVVPTILYTLAFYWADRYEREPIRLVGVAFLWGALPAIVVSFVGEVIINARFIGEPGSVAERAMSTAVVAPVVEEMAKGMALLALYHWMHREFDGVLDGLIYGALIGFGFAMTENFLYFIGAFNEGGLATLTQVIVLRAIVFGLNHAVYTGFTGIGFGWARHAKTALGRWSWPAAALVVAMLAHSLHNLGAVLAEVAPISLLLNGVVASLGIGLVGLALKLAWREERKWIEQELAEEVGHVLSAQEYAMLTSESRQSFLPSRSPMWRLSERLRLCVELAFHKHRLRRLGVDREPALPDEIERLREELSRAQS
jgi:RsiW-degrading membrane proteinase PrsW (M82 family)